MIDNFTECCSCAESITLTVVSVSGHFACLSDHYPLISSAGPAHITRRSIELASMMHLQQITVMLDLRFVFVVRFDRVLVLAIEHQRTLYLIRVSFVNPV